MATVFVRSKVADYDAWRRSFDSHEEFRKGAGAIGQAVYQLDGSPTDVTVAVDFASMDAAKAFAGSAELRERMQESGVVGPPDLWFTERV